MTTKRRSAPVADEWIDDHCVVSPQFGKGGRLLKLGRPEGIHSDVIAEMTSRMHDGQHLVSIDAQECLDHFSCCLFRIGFSWTEP